MSAPLSAPLSATRRLASRLLHAVARHASSDCQDWANAMLRELDFIENDWAALFWALGSTTAIFRQHSARGFKALFRKGSSREGEQMNNIGKKAVGVVSGFVVASTLVLSAFGLLFLASILFPSLDLEHVEWTHWLTVIVIPEVIFIIAVVKLWNKRRSVAAGILLSAITLGAHFAIHVAANWRG
jgi:hypothetical protein